MFGFGAPRQLPGSGYVRVRAAANPLVFGSGFGVRVRGLVKTRTIVLLWRWRASCSSKQRDFPAKKANIFLVSAIYFMLIFKSENRKQCIGKEISCILRMDFS